MLHQGVLTNQLHIPAGYPKFGLEIKAEGNSVAVHSMGDVITCVSAHCWQLILYREQGSFHANINVKYCKYFFLEGLHAVSVWGQADCGHSRSEGAGVGFEEHGVRSAAKGIQPEVPDPLHQSIPQQTGMAAIPAEIGSAGKYLQV